MTESNALSQVLQALYRPVLALVFVSAIVPARTLMGALGVLPIGLRYDPTQKTYRRTSRTMKVGGR